MKDSPKAFVPERIANVILGVNVYALVILGLVTSAEGDRWSTVRISISLLNFVVGTLLITRSQAQRHGKLSELLMALPSLFVCGFAFRSAPPPGQWPVFAQVAFAVATAFAILSLISLGRNFAVLPALRSVTNVGPYAWIRHPAYVGETGMLFACWWASPNWIAAAACVAIIPLIVLRIVAEERVLSTSRDYVAYSNAVPWRVVPGVW